MRAHCDVLIIGGGPVGSTLALSPAGLGLTTVVLEARREFTQDSRTLALSYNSRLILEQLGVWQKVVHSNPIESVHVSQRNGFGALQLHAKDLELPALGYTLKYGDLRRALDALLKASSVDVVDGARVVRRDSVPGYAVAHFTVDGAEHVTTSSVLAIADGGASSDARVRDYAQCAIVSEVRAESAPATVAFERFRANGTIALLPKADEWALIWSVPSANAQQLLSLSSEDFLRELQNYFGDRVGAFIEVGSRSSFPLVSRALPKVSRDRMIWLGNAAQTLHPVMAQGLNLGLRDAFELGRLIARTSKEDIGSERMLAMYRTRRMRDRSAAMLVTDSMVRLFSLDASSLLTAMGLNALNSMPLAKRFFIRRAIFGA